MEWLASAASPQDGKRPRLLLNSRADIAAAAHADGVHLTSRVGELTSAQVRAVFRSAELPHCLVSKSCHTAQEVLTARQDDADIILFSPVFGKVVDGEEVRQATGLAGLREACATAAPLPVLALGSVTSSNIAACLDAGAAGVAGIRLFDRAAQDADPDVRK